MKKTKLISLVILSALLIGIVGSAVAYQEYIYRWKDEASGDDHTTGCHGGSTTTESATGTLTLSINETGNLAPLQPFTLDVIVNNFTEANEDPYYRLSTRGDAGKITLGVPGYMGDNAMFTSSLSHQTLNRGESVDQWGSYEDTSDNEFMLFAPNAAGTYELWAVVIAGVNQSSENHAAAYNLTYIEDSITITVVAPATGGGDGGTIPGGILAITIGSVFVVSTLMIIILKKKNIIRRK